MTVSGLHSGPVPVTFEASQSAESHVHALINPCSIICNMQLNVLNDLAEAKKALDRKNHTTLVL